MFPVANKLRQRELISYESCKEWCDEFDDCHAVVVSPSYWAYRECFLVSTTIITRRTRWSALCSHKSVCQGPPKLGKCPALSQRSKCPALSEQDKYSALSKLGLCLALSQHGKWFSI